MRAARITRRAARLAHALACRSGEELDADSEQSSVGRAGVRRPMSSMSANGALCGPSAVQCQPRALHPQAETETDVRTKRARRRRVRSPWLAGGAVGVSRRMRSARRARARVWSPHAQSAHERTAATSGVTEPLSVAVLGAASQLAVADLGLEAWAACASPICTGSGSMTGSR
jgi:hypothetical protein